MKWFLLVAVTTDYGSIFVGIQWSLKSDISSRSRRYPNAKEETGVDFLRQKCRYDILLLDEYAVSRA